MATIEQWVGRRIAGKYQLEALIGKGGFGAVFRATHHPIGRAVAVKINLHRTRADLHARFVREAQVQAHLRHPACVMLLDFGEAEDFFYMVQEFVDGPSLKQELEANGAMAPHRAASLVLRLLDGLSAAHRLGIVHRDVKPANIMLTRDDAGEDVRILDFGIAKLLSSEDDQNLTGTGMSLGTPAFMAPEQIRNRPVDARADIYAAGAVLYRLCAGHGPYTGEATIDVLRQHLEAPVPALPGAPPALSALIEKAMAKAPDDRFASAGEMRRAVEAALPALAGRPPLTALQPPGTTDGPTTTLGEGMVISEADPAPPARGRRRIGAVLALCALGVALGLWWVRQMDGPPPPPTGPVAATAAVEPAPAEAPPPDATRPDATPPDRGPLDAAPDAAWPLIGDIEILDPHAPVAAHTPKAAPKPKARSKPKTRPKPKVRPKPKADPKAAFTAALGRCDCPKARAALARLREADPPGAAALDGRFQDECEMFAPGNCRDKRRKEARR